MDDTHAPGPPTPDAPSDLEEEIASVDARDPDAAEVVHELAGDAPGGAIDVESMMCDVSFRFTPGDDLGDVSNVSLVGDFNSWSEAAHPMHAGATDAATGRPTFTITVPLLRDHRYRYRFLVDGHRWCDDPEATEHEDNGYGGSDCVRVT